MADVLAIVAAYFGTFFLRFHSDFGEKLYGALPKLIAQESLGMVGSIHQTFYLESATRIILILTGVICMLYALHDLYSGKRFLIEQPIAWKVFISNIVALGIFYTYWYLERNVYHPRSVFASIIVLNIIFCISFRRLGSRALAAFRQRSGIGLSKAILVGRGEELEYVKALLELLRPHGICCAQTISLDREISFVEQLEKIVKVITDSRADILICVERDLSVPQIMQILAETDALGISTKILSEKLDVLVSRAHLPCDVIHGVPLVHFEAPGNHGELGRIRRSLTVILASIALLLLSPLLIIVALLVTLTSKGPSIFTQERIGVNRKPFMMYKFRTMRDKAEELQAQVEEFNESSDVIFKIKKDPRITPVGRFLRRFSLDELPQLINVVKGDMALVGPRPLPKRDFANYYEDWHYSRHDGLPGLTCLWQVSGRSDIDFHNMCILDVYYLRNHSWLMDIKIFLRTFKVVLFGTGAY